MRALILLVTVLAGSEPAMAYEEPRYEVRERTDAFELRRYEPCLVAETEVEADFDEAGNRAFRILAAYIGGENRSRAKVAMTAPVNQQPAPGEKISMTVPVNQAPAPADGDDRYRIQFVMPASFDAETIPEPTDPRVTIRGVPERWVAARRYSGTWSEARYRENEAELLDAVREAGLETVGEPVFARYNSPFSLWFLRRNEVTVEVRSPAPKR